MIMARIIADSANKWGDRLTTFECTYPRFIHCQLMTHRQFSRNAASSRAIPTKQMLKRVVDDPVWPVFWGRNQGGMQAYEELSWWRKLLAKWTWKRSVKSAVKFAKRFEKIGVHKQIANRVLEPYTYITTIITATDYANFFHLRLGDAQPEIQALATEMYDSYMSSIPKFLSPGEWHTPYVDISNQDSPLYVPPEFLSSFMMISSARCARVSYLTHNGKRNFLKDIELHDKLVSSGHWSPLEHVAMAEDHSLYIGNIRGFKQYRKFFDNECVKEFKCE